MLTFNQVLVRSCGIIAELQALVYVDVDAEVVCCLRRRLLLGVVEKIVFPPTVVTLRPRWKRFTQALIRSR